MRRDRKRRWDDGRRTNRLTPIEQTGWRHPDCGDCGEEMLIEPNGIVHYITGKDGTIAAFFCAECGRKREDDDFKDRKRRQ